MVKKLGLLPAGEIHNFSDPPNPGYVPGSLLSEAVKLLPGDLIHNFTQPDPPNKVVLVLFLGGYTMAEVAAFRWLQTVTGHQFLIAGTNIISGNRVVSEAEKL